MRRCRPLLEAYDATDIVFPVWPLEPPRAENRFEVWRAWSGTIAGAAVIATLLSVATGLAIVAPGESSISVAAGPSWRDPETTGSIWPALRSTLPPA